MADMLLQAKTTNATAAEFLRENGEVFAVFDARTQDSGNVSYGVRSGGKRFFVKSAGEPEDPTPHLAYSQRVNLLRNAVRLATAIRHRALPRFHKVIESREGPLLVYDWFDGEMLRADPPLRQDPTTAYARVRALPPAEVLAALDVVFDLHAGLAAEGWIAVDFYDGCLMYDFSARDIRVVDLDHYSRGPFVNEMGRMFGSTRFMAPEEFQRGARIDERTNVYTMGRTLLELLGDGSEDRCAFRGPSRLLAVGRRACNRSPADRYASVADFLDAFRGAS